jgi:hypothetical protein
VHLPDDAAHFLCSLNEVNCFPFENCLQAIKKMVRNSKNPIAQITKQFVERASAAPAEYFHRSCNFDKIRETFPDNCFLVADDFVFVKQIKEKDFVLCHCYRKTHAKPFYSLKLGVNNCPSDLFGIVYLRQNVNFRSKLLHRKSLVLKVVALPYKDGLVLQPLLHGDEH